MKIKLSVDLLIKNGTIIDGTGRKAYRGDVAIEKGKIKKIGNLARLRAVKIIDARGYVVAPGFVDILNHSDSYLTLFNIPDFDSIIRQGVTSILIGQCGSSLAPLIDSGSLLSLQKWADINEANVNWLKMGEFLDELEKKRFSINIATLVGHATLRRGILGEEFRTLTTGELAQMKFMVSEALESGAFGLSTGLAYSHAKNASRDELEELARVVKKYDALYATHLRDESRNFLQSLNEAINIAREADVSCEISHMKVIGKDFWPQMEKGVEIIETMWEHKMDINFDVYPYLTIGSVLYIFLPDWVASGGKKMLLTRLGEPAIRERLIKEMEKNHYDYRKIIFAFSPHDKTFVGKSVSEIAFNEGVSPEEAILNALVASDGRIIVFMDVLSEKNLIISMRSRASFVASDGFGYNEAYRKRGELVHPRSFGAFPRFLGRFIREKEHISWEDGIQKISSGPAKKIGLKQRGELKKGYFADVTIFDPNTVLDNATFNDPFQYPTGIKHVIVNGEVIIENEKPTGKMAGKVLRRS